MLLLLGDNTPAPAFDAPFLSGVLPAGLTYTNSSTTRTYFGADGLLKTAAANAPIFEYNPVTLALLGMRWEMEQRTNLLLQSILPGGGAAPTGWTQVAGTGTSAAAASIYGNSDGAAAYLHTATAQRPFFAHPSVSLSANTTYTHSVLIESVSGTISANNAILILGAPAGAVVSFPVCSANPAGNDSGTIQAGILEIRIAVGATAGAITLRIGLGCSGNATGTIQFSRPQFEVGASRSSFIPTTTAAVIRQPDVLAASSISWYRQDEGTVLFEGIMSDLAASRGMYIFSDGTNNNRLYSYFGGGSALTEATVSGSPTATVDLGAYSSVGSIFRTATAYKLNDYRGSINGSAGAGDTSSAVPPVSQLRLGAVTVAGAVPFMGYARRFQYYNTRLPNAQIQGMSRV